MQVEDVDHENWEDIDVTNGAPTIGTTTHFDTDWSHALSPQWLHRVAEFVGDDAVMNAHYFDSQDEVDITH